MNSNETSNHVFIERSAEYKAIVSKELQTDSIKALIREAFGRITKNESTDDLIAKVSPVTASADESLKRKVADEEQMSKKVKVAEVKEGTTVKDVKEFAVDYQVAAKVSTEDPEQLSWIVVKIKSLNFLTEEYVVVDADETDESPKEWTLLRKDLVDFQCIEMYRKDDVVLALYAFEDDEFSTAFYQATVLKAAKDVVHIEYEDGEKASVNPSQVFLVSRPE